MPSLSVARLHLGSRRYLLPFGWNTLQIVRQVKRSEGFCGGALAGDPQKGNWTVTVWRDREAILRFRNGGAHLKAMRRLMNWCDEASFAHWDQAEVTLPDPGRLYERLRSAGRLSKVRNPSPLQAAGRTVADAPPRIQLALKPRGGRAK